MIGWLARLHGLDRRWLYGATVVVLLVPMLVSIPMPAGTASPPTRDLYAAVESCPPDKVVVVDSSWDAGSAAENRAQLECLVQHLCRRGIKFVVTSIGIAPFAPQFAELVIGPIAAQAGYVYGRDWVNLGYVPGPPPGSRTGGMGVVIEGLCRDFRHTFPQDARGTPTSTLALMDRVRTWEDVHLFCVITYQADDDWISVISGMFGSRLGVGCMSIAGPDFYRYFDSRQLVGGMIGNRGAAEYELLLGQPGRGTRLTMAGSFGNCAVILAALVGNLGWWAARRTRRSQP